MNATQLIILIIAVGALWLVLTYNRLVTLRNRVKEAFSDIEVQLKRRYDLIPNLVEAVKGYAAHEKGIFENVAAARSRAMGAANPAEKAQAENALSQTLKSLFAVAENYPDLKASANFLSLQGDVRDAEDKIQAARRFHNTNVLALNNAIQGFPGGAVAKTFGFKQEEFFGLDEKAEGEAPQVKF